MTHVRTRLPRSLLFVPGDSERKQTRAVACGADALILDLEDSVSAGQLPAARQRVCSFLHAHADDSGPQLWVRVNSLDSGILLEDLVAVMPGRPYGIVLPKIRAPSQLDQVDHYLSALEAREGLAGGTTCVLVIATETPQAVLTADGYARHNRRLAALTWGTEDLSAAIGANLARIQQREPSFIDHLARSICLLSAAAAGVPAVDCVHTDFRDHEGLKAAAAQARRDGFVGKLAIHPEQVDLINAAFSPTTDELDQARRIVAAFEGSPDSGAVAIDGRMFDRPHLVQAQRILSLDAASDVPGRS
jgi:citrate lyase subunit beta / citryl-CoA lyase